MVLYQGKPRCIAPPPHRAERGFTFIELMIVLIVLSILIAVAAPGFQSLLGNNRMISEVYALRATLNHARSEAMARRATVIVCPTSDGAACASSDDWASGYMSFVDTDGNSATDPNNPDEEIIQLELINNSVDLAFNNASQLVRFNPEGIALGFEGTFTFCDERGASEARALIVNPVGAISAASDTDTPEDYIVNDAAKNNVICN